MHSRRLMLAALAFSAIAAASLPCIAQSFPVPGRPVRIVVPFPPGGQADFQARLLAPELSAALGVPVVIDNRPGASSIIGVQEVARATPNGHTLLYTIASPIVVNPQMFANLPYDALRDLVPIALTAITAQVLVARASLPANDIEELVEYAKANPGKLNFSSYGEGTSSHLYGEMLKASTGIDIVHVPYKGAADATKDLVAGRIDLMFMAPTAPLPYLQQRTLKVLGVVGDKRISSMPGVPTIVEQGYRGLELTGWLGMFAPAGTPASIVDRLNLELARILHRPAIVERFRNGGSDATSTTPKAFAELVRNDHQRWGEVVRRLGITAR
jgi:tripartite-type tricarboxylate transporter receptor subunit TctC